MVIESDGKPGHGAQIQLDIVQMAGYQRGGGEVFLKLKMKEKLIHAESGFL